MLTLRSRPRSPSQRYPVYYTLTCPVQSVQIKSTALAIKSQIIVSSARIRHFSKRPLCLLYHGSLLGHHHILAKRVNLATIPSPACHANCLVIISLQAIGVAGSRCAPTEITSSFLRLSSGMRGDLDPKPQFDEVHECADRTLLSVQLVVPRTPRRR